MNKLILIIVMFLCILKGYTQKQIGVVKPAVKVIGKVTKNSTLLRWSANTSTAWKYANQYGYIIERTTIAIGSEILKEPIVKRLTSSPLKPKPMMEWENLAAKNDNAAIIAQAIYGDDFEVEMEEGTNALMSIMNTAKAQEQRFSFALYAADQDFEVAKLAGLGFIDNDVRLGEKYLYKIFTAIPSDKMTVDFGGVYLGLDDYHKLPEPQELIGLFNDKSVMLSWSYKLLEKQYNSYIVERSDDLGKTFKQLNGVPVINMNEKEKGNSDRMFFLDSIPKNNVEYQYRIKGKSPFGEIGPLSNIIKGKGKKSLQYNPAITKATITENASVTINWEFPEEDIKSLAYFQLNISNTIKGTYQVAVTEISKTQRSIIFNKLSPINYFTITAVGYDGSKRKSFPQMVQLDDATPPEIPTNLTGIIDSTGVVKLNWKLNTEPDFLGYRVFRANLENEEFTQITFEPTAYNTIIDTVKIKNLNPKVYYKIQAFDKRYNPSGFSEILALKKPDIVPPTKPVFKSFLANNGEVQLNWIPSSSTDALKTLIYRKEKGKPNDWQLVTTVNLPGNKFIDKTAETSVSYLYTLITMDTSGLESEPVIPLTISLTDNVPKTEIAKFSSIVNRQEHNITLSWKYKTAEVSEFLLYRSTAETKPALYKAFQNTENTYVDTNLLINTKYTYLLQAVFNSGALSPMKKIEVKY